MFDFDGRIVVVTGSSRGIGRRIAERFYAAGASVAICSRKRSDIEQALLEIGGGDQSRLLGGKADSSRPEEMAAFLQSVVERFGRIDILINNAGVQIAQPAVEMSEAAWDATFDINLKGYFFAAQFAARDMLRRNAPGVIINIGSVHAVTVLPGQAAYASAKAGISQMTRILGREWAKAGIRVNCIAPGSIPTAMNAAVYADPEVERAMVEKIPMGRRGTTDEVADATLYLASEFASYITGQTLFVDGGLTLVHG